MKRRRFIIECILVLLCIVLSVCSFIILLLKYNKLETRISRLEGNSSISSVYFENNIESEDNKEDTSNWKTIEVTEGVPDVNEYDEFTVVLTPENINTYVSLTPYDLGENSSDSQYKNICLWHRSNIYDKGWVFEEESSDFSLYYTFSSNLLSYFKLFNIEHCTVNKNEFKEEDVKLSQCAGKLRFINIKHVVTDNVDDMSYIRDVEFSNGKRARYRLDTETYKIPF